MFGAGDWALAGSENDPTQTAAVNLRTHPTQELVLISVTFFSQGCSDSLLVKLERTGKGSLGNLTGNRKERPRQKSIAVTLPAPVTRSRAQASSQSIRGGRAARLAACN